jgi:nucleotide-binding universal stress UspA family protein
MYQGILLCTDGSPGSDVAADYAIWFARQLGARLHALYVTDIRILEGPLVADISGALGAQPYAGLVPLLQRIQQEKASTTLNAVAARCQAKGVPVTTTHETGPLVSVLLDHERQADLVVLGQRGEHAQWHGEMLGSSVERMLRASIKPCLLAAGEFRPIQHMMIAYDGSAESNQALHAGIDLAPSLAVKQVTIVTVCQRDQEESASKILQEGQQLASDHQVKASTQLVHGHPETELLDLSGKLQADLLVMGAYGHTRIREFILGSTTSHVIRKTKVPVLLSRS